MSLEQLENNALITCIIITQFKKRPRFSFWGNKIGFLHTSMQLVIMYVIYFIKIEKGVFKDRSNGNTA